MLQKYLDVLKIPFSSSRPSYHKTLTGSYPQLVQREDGRWRLQNGEIPSTSEGATRQESARDHDKLMETTPEKLLFKVPGVGQRKIHHSKEMSLNLKVYKLRQITCFSYKLLRNLMDLLGSNKGVLYNLL